MAHYLWSACPLALHSDCNSFGRGKHYSTCQYFSAVSPPSTLWFFDDIHFIFGYPVLLQCKGTISFIFFLSYANRKYLL